MTDTSWTIHTDSDGALTLPGALGTSLPPFGVGRSIPIIFFADSPTDPDFVTLREYARYTNESTTNTGLDIRGKPWYHESRHPNADFSSALVRLEPGEDVGELEEWWCVITDVSISTTPMGTAPRITLELFFLGEASDFADRDHVEETFEAGL